MATTSRRLFPSERNNLKTYTNKPFAELSWSNRHGRKVKTAWLPNGDQINNVETDVVCIVDNRGDRDEIWLVVIRDGKELSRHNTRHVESIQWE